MIKEICYYSLGMVCIIMCFSIMGYVMFSETGTALWREHDFHWLNFVKVELVAIGAALCIFAVWTGSSAYCKDVNQKIENYADNGYSMYLDGTQIDKPVKINTSRDYKFKIDDENRVIAFTKPSKTRFFPIIIR